MRGLLRADALRVEDLELAKHLGYQPAAKALGLTAAGAKPPWREPGFLSKASPDVARRVSLAVARAAAVHALRGQGWTELSAVVMRVQEAVAEGGSLPETMPREIVDATSSVASDLADARQAQAWEAVEAGSARALRQEFLREIGPQRGRHTRRVNDLLVIARFAGSDDVLGWVMKEEEPDGALAAVHLTYSEEHDPRWPGSTLYERARDFVAAERSVADDWGPEGALEALMFAVAPATFEERPALNAVLACSFAHSALPAFTVEKAIRDEVIPWVLGLRDPLAERVAARSEAPSFERRP